MKRNSSTQVLQAVVIMLFNCFSAQAATTVTPQSTTTSPTGLTTTQQIQSAQTTQTLVNTQNTLLVVAGTATTTVNPLYSAATSINLLYGTSFNSSGPSSSAWDKQVYSMIVNTPGYTAAGYAAWATKTADLYKSLQTSSTQRAKFNQLYQSWLPATGSPILKDAHILFGITANTSYVKSTFLTALSTATKPPLTPISPLKVPGSTTTTTTPSPTTTPTTTPTIPTSSLTGKLLFSATSVWNKLLSPTQAISSNSQALVNELINNVKMAPAWFNTSSYSTPYYVVDSTTPKAPVSIVQNGQVLSWTVLNSLTQKGVPIPSKVAAAAGTDGTLTIYDKSTDRLYEFWQFRNVNGKWQASWGGILEHASTSNGVMPTVINSAGGKEYFGATATGLPAIAGTIKLSELAAGKIPHALAFAIPAPAAGKFVAPATRTDGWATWANAIPEGTRFKFPSNIYIDPSWSPLMKMMVIAIRDYGMVLRDRAGSVAFFGEDPRQYGAGDPYTQYYGGKQLWDVMGQFPWSKLQAVA